MWKERTTWVGLTAIVLVSALTWAYIAGKVEADGVVMVGGMIATVLGGMLMYGAKDKTTK